MQRDREQVGLTVEQAARLVGVSPRRYRAFEDGEVWPAFETYERIADLFGWPRSFVASGTAR